MSSTTLMIRLHAALAKRGLMDEKRDIIREHTLGRTDRASELTEAELAELAASLSSHAPRPSSHEDAQRQRMIRSLYFHARQLGWFAPAEKGKEVKVDTDRLNAWCEKHTPAHLPFAKMDVEQLAEAVTCIKNYVKTDTERIAR